MNFFDYIKNESFFKPFTLKYRRIYYDCIQLLIDKLKELPVLYESDARDSITIYLRNAEIKNMMRLQETGEPRKTGTIPGWTRVIHKKMRTVITMWNCCHLPF